MASFIDVAGLSAYLQRDLDADLAAIAVDSACDVLKSEANQSWDLVANDEVVLDCDGGDTLLLPELPVTSVASLAVSGTPLTEGTHYVVDKEEGILRTKSVNQNFLKGRQIYTAVYTHGYTEGEYPKTLTLLAYHLAARIYDQGIVSSESVGSVSMSYATPESIVLTTREKNLLERAVGVGRRR